MTKENVVYVRKVRRQTVTRIKFELASIGGDWFSRFG